MARYSRSPTPRSTVNPPCFEHARNGIEATGVGALAAHFLSPVVGSGRGVRGDGPFAWNAVGLVVGSSLAIRRSSHAGTHSQAQAVLRETAQSSNHRHRRGDHYGRGVAG